MRASLILFLLLGSSALLRAQTDCQAIEPVISHNASAEFNDLLLHCPDETIIFDVGLFFPENDQTYTQSENSSTFDWQLNGTTIATTPDVQFDAAAVTTTNNLLTLTVTDVMGCDTTVEVALQTIPAPEITYEYTSSSGAGCVIPGDTITLTATAADSVFVLSDQVTTYDTLQLIPDGNGLALATALTVDQAPPGMTVADALNDLKVCVTMEHSWARDLDIKLYAPNGLQVDLRTFEGQSGGQIFLGIPNDSDSPVSPIPGVGFQYCWSMNAPNPTWTEMFAQMPSTLPAGTYLPDEPFTAFNDAPLNGTWALEILDLWAIDNGVLFDWSIHTPTPDGSSLGIATTSVTWNGTEAGVLNADGNTLQLVVPDAPTATYELTVENEFGCALPAFYTLETVDNPLATDCLPCDQLIVDAGPDRFLPCDGNGVDLNPTHSSGATFTYLWQLNGAPITPWTTEPNLIVTQPGLYEFFQQREDGCLRGDAVFVAEVELDNNLGDGTVTTSCASDTRALTFQTTGGSGMYNYNLNGQTSSFPNFTVSSNVGLYLLQTTDVTTNCSIIDTITVVPGTNDILGAAPQPASCGVANGALTVLLADPAVDYQIDWSNGQSGPTALGLASGFYNVTVSNAVCTSEETFFLDETDECKAQISGRVILEPTCDVTNTLAPGVPGIMLQLLPDNVFTYTDSQGNYHFARTDGGDYTVVYVEEDTYDQGCPNSGQILVGTVLPGETSEDHNFYVSKAPVNNVCVDGGTGATRPGFDQINYFAVCNLGCETVSPVLTVTLDSLLTPTDAGIFDTYDPTTQTGTLSIPLLAPGACFYLGTLFNVSVGAPLGEVVVTQLNVSIPEADAFPGNNDFALASTVTGSYDPNDKQNFTGEAPFGGAIYAEDTLMRYQIRFQNTGTDTAFTVVIRDTLATDLLDVTTIRPLSSSHDYQVEFEGSDVLVFRFDDILLPDSTTNLAESQGYVNFTIRRRTDLPIGTEIANTAAIYFDFNAPVITNTVVNVLSEPTLVRTPELLDVAVRLSPNPVAEVLNVNLQTDRARTLRLELLDATGRRWSEPLDWRVAPGRSSRALDVRALPAGAYFLRVTAGNVVRTVRFVRR